MLQLLKILIIYTVKKLIYPSIFQGIEQEIISFGTYPEEHVACFGKCHHGGLGMPTGRDTGGALS